MSGILCFRNIGQLVQADASTQPGIRLRKNCALLVENGRSEEHTSELQSH